MDKIILVVLGEPKAQARHRHFSKGKFTQTYDPSAEKKGTFASIVQVNAPENPLEGPLSLEINFYFHHPKCDYKSGKNSNVLKDNAPEWHTKKPDIDNLQKFIMDSLNKIFWRDDSIICQVVARKMYSENPRTEIVIQKLLSL